MDFPLKYIGQTARTFYTRYKEHIQAIRNKSNSGYSNHILSTGRANGGVTDTMKIKKLEENGKPLNTMEKYHIYIYIYIYINVYNPIFENLQELNVR
jgi:hypothetical protein